MAREKQSAETGLEMTLRIEVELLVSDISTQKERKAQSEGEVRVYLYPLA